MAVTAQGKRPGKAPAAQVQTERERCAHLFPFNYRHSTGRRDGIFQSHSRVITDLQEGQEQTWESLYRLLKLEESGNQTGLRSPWGHSWSLKSWITWKMPSGCLRVLGAENPRIPSRDRTNPSSPSHGLTGTRITLS